MSTSFVRWIAVTALMLAGMLVLSSDSANRDISVVISNTQSWVSPW